MALSAVACADTSTPDPAARWALESIDSFGEPGIEGVPGPGLLGSPRSATWTRSGIVVADQQTARLVAFDSSGRVAAEVGGEGDGPGEFRSVIDVTGVSDSMVSALDVQTGRVTTFRLPSFAADRIITGIPPDAFFHRWLADTIWVVRPNAGSVSPMATAYLAASGAEVASAPPSSVEDQPYGAAFGLDAIDSRLVTSTRRPGVWWERADGEWRRVGQPLFPDAPPRQRIDVQPGLSRIVPSPADVADIALLGDSLVVQLLVLRPGVQEAENPRTVPHENALAVFRARGDHLATLQLDAGVGCVESAPDSVLLFCAWAPYPQVRRYRLVRTPE